MVIVINSFNLMHESVERAGESLNEDEASAWEGHTGSVHTSSSLTPPQGQGIMVVADLGCSSGLNALLVVSEVTSTLRDCIRDETEDDDRRHSSMAAVQFFLNDLPGNDFNTIFRSLVQLTLQNLASETEAADELPCYVAGLPGSFYTRLFPSNNVHLFHSSYSLMWRSKVYICIHSHATT